MYYFNDKKLPFDFMMLYEKSIRVRGIEEEKKRNWGIEN